MKLRFTLRNWNSRYASPVDTSRSGAKHITICAVGCGSTQPLQLSEMQTDGLHADMAICHCHGLKSNDLVESIWLKIVSPLDEFVACVTVNPVSEYRMALECPPTSAIGTVSVIVPGLDAV